MIAVSYVLLVNDPYSLDLETYLAIDASHNPFWHVCTNNVTVSDNYVSFSAYLGSFKFRFIVPMMYIYFCILYYQYILLQTVLFCPWFWLCQSLQHKYQRMTELSRTLQEDASCQLLCVLRRYIHKDGTTSVEIAVNSDTIPQLITIQKGILALTRQWKNILYMPHLSQYSFKARKQRPYTVSFEVQETEPNFMEDDAASVDIVDENASLIDDDAVSYRKSDSIVSLHKLKPYASGTKAADAAQDNTPVIARSRSSTCDNLANRPRGSRRERAVSYVV